MAVDQISCEAFAQYLVDQQPHYDREIIRTITPTDGSWIGHVSTGTFPAHEGVSLYQDRFENVWPNTTRPWDAKAYASCVGNPCAKTENQIGWGASRLSYFLEEQQWATPLLCFDALMHVSKAKENMRQIISDVLTPATSAIMSMFLRKRALFWAGKKFVATSSFGQSASEFNYVWVNDADGNEVFLHTDKIPTSKLTPQMLQRRVGPLMRIGYFGKTPFENESGPPLIELVTSMETVWELDHLGGSTGVGGNGNPSVQNNWRFQQWESTNKYWRYGFTGQMGNFATRTDPYEMRFQYAGGSGDATYPHRFQLILPYINVVSSGAGGAAGIKREDNPDYETACYRMSFTHHKRGMQALMMEPTTINPEMPYGSRNFGGKWKFVIPDVCVAPDGTITAIDNRRKNQGQFLADFLLAIRPLYTEFMEAYFHMAEPACVLEVAPCNVCTEYSDQLYSSANLPC